jgi:2-polyprenyl-6-hydroxyphenyl methylase/3-demethylubiquinone-9 3-methyltransferase
MDRHRKKTINNSFYDQLGEDWYSGVDHPIALLRAENALRIPWIAKTISPLSCVLDIGCGAGFLTNALAQAGHRVSGIDLSQKSLEIAERHDSTRSVDYREASAYTLPYLDETFDAVCAMDVLEHVEDPRRLIEEASRVLKPKGLFFFHTFNRNLLSYLLVIKGVDWCVPNAPKNMHVYHLFIKPKELEEMCETNRLAFQALLGFEPRFSKPLWKMVLQRRVPPDFSFKFSISLKTGYCGFAKKHVNLTTL